MSLRLQVNLIITVLLGLMASLLVGLQIDNTRRSVRDEVDGANVVASQLLGRVNWVYGYGGLDGMREFLNGVGRVRANDIQLFDALGQQLYRSPPSPYKPGREAPGWYTRLVSPPLAPREIALPSGRIVLYADPSRAVLDGWDDLLPMLGGVLAGFALANAAVWALMGRALKPLQQVAEGLRAMEGGHYAIRLPEQGGREPRLVAQAFNRMAQAVQDKAEAQRAAQEARQALAESRELAQLVHARIEEERGAIARELHDELGQQITAIKSAGLTIQRRLVPGDPALSQSAQLVLSCADHIYEGMHRLVARLRPLALDPFGLGDALQDLLGDWRQSHPGLQFSLRLEGPLDSLDEATASAAYRIVQEAVTNALRHAQAQHIEVAVTVQAQSVLLWIADDGQGQLDDLHAPRHYGVAGMRERAQALGGELVFEQRPTGGLALRARLPRAGLKGDGA